MSSRNWYDKGCWVKLRGINFLLYQVSAKWVEKPPTPLLWKRQQAPITYCYIHAAHHVQAK